MYSKEEVAKMTRIDEYRNNHRKYLEGIFEEYFDEYHVYINKKALYLQETYGKVDMNKLLNMPFHVWYETYIVASDADSPEPNVVIGSDGKGFSDSSIGEVLWDTKGNLTLYKLYAEGIHSLTKEDKKNLGICK